MNFFMQSLHANKVYAKLHNKRQKIYRSTIDVSHISKRPLVMPYLGVNRGEPKASHRLLIICLSGFVVCICYLDLTQLISKKEDAG